MFDSIGTGPSKKEKKNGYSNVDRGSHISSRSEIIFGLTPKVSEFPNQYQSHQTSVNLIRCTYSMTLFATEMKVLQV